MNGGGVWEAGSSESGDNVLAYELKEIVRKGNRVLVPLPSFAREYLRGEVDVHIHVSGEPSDVREAVGLLKHAV